MVLGPQFVTLYRGVTDPDGTGDALINRTNDLGQHWSVDKGVAEHFASFDQEGYETPGWVVTAQVHRRHIVNPGTIEHSRMKASHDVHSANSYERELPVRKGGIVHVRSVEHNSEPKLNWTDQDIATRFGSRRTGRA